MPPSMRKPSAGQTGTIQIGQVVCKMGRKLANRLHSEGGDQSGWQPVTNGVLQGLTMGPMLFIFTNDLNDVIESPLTKIADDTKLSGEVETREGRAVIWRELDGLGERARKNNIKFHRDKSCVWDNINKEGSTGWDLCGGGAALLEGAWGSWWTRC